ncbi:MAG TPA: hypothetical protein VEI02_07955 [Planctomycetota bacterium]|nr:hypothetical protein [Planctomycetota bacterium]
MFLRTPHLLLTALIAATASVAAAQESAPSAPLVRGAKAPEYAFTGPMLNGDGRRALADFRGQTLFINWWSRWCPACRQGVVPFAEQIREQKGDAVACVLVETQPLTEEQLLAVMARMFPRNRCTTVAQQPGLDLEPPASDFPYAALIGVDGTVLWHGHPMAQQRKIQSLIDEQSKLAQAGWGATPETKKARSLLYGKNDLAGAAAALDQAEKSRNGAERKDAKADLDAARAEVEARFVARRRAVSALLQAGEPLEAQRRAAALLKDVRNRKPWEKEAQDLVASFKTPEADRELKADQALQKWRADAGDGPPSAAAVEALSGLARKFEGTKVAVRATAVAAALRSDFK